MIPDSKAYYLAFARDLAISSGRIALKAFRKSNGWLKDNKSYVTETDLEIQEFIERSIKKAFPSHHFLGEENGDGTDQSIDEEWVWLIDPIDGTDAFASDLPSWGVSLALMHNGEPYTGVFYQPVTRELYHAAEESESMITLDPGMETEENKTLQVHLSPEFHNRSLFLVTSDFHRKWQSDFPGKQRILGSIAAHYCVVARGAAIACYGRPHSWDIAAGTIIVREAGGEVYDMDTGEPIRFADYINRKRMPYLLAVSSNDVFVQLKEKYLKKR